MLYTRKYYRRAFPFLLFIKRIYHTQVEWSMSKNMHTVTQATNDEVKMKAEDESNEWLVTTEAKSFFSFFFYSIFQKARKREDKVNICGWIICFSWHFNGGGQGT